jgi:NAD-dependent deacetylase
MSKNLQEIMEKSKRMVFFGGAGVSTESQIPDFRSEKGLYQAQEEYGFPPEIMLSRSFFDRSPEIFYRYYKENLIHRDARPNDSHKALAHWEERGNLLGVVTQNIDGLHQKAGSRQVVELHGSVHRNFCMNCGAPYTVDQIFHEEMLRKDNEEPNLIPYCTICGGMVKPDVVLYEEPLNHEEIERAIGWIRQCDTLIVGGTSLMVYPAAGLIDYFQGEHLVLINKTETPFDEKATLVYHDSIGKVLGETMGKERTS